MAQTVYLSLGSNLGDRERNLRAAVEALARELRVRSVSSLYETDPVGVVDQPSFLNVALEAETSLVPADLLALVKRIEKEVGREPTYRWGPRVVDIDIVLYGDLVMQTPTLTIPHPEMQKRAFVLVPLAEIAGDVIHPVLHLRIEELRDRVQGREGVDLVGPFG